MAATTTIVKAGDKPHKFSWDMINQANPAHLVAAVQRRTDIWSENLNLHKSSEQEKILKQ